MTPDRPAGSARSFPPTVLRPYMDVVATPGGRLLVAAGLVARLPMSTYGIGLLLLLSAQGRSYGFTGISVALYGLASVLAAPLAGTLYDRLGQRRVLVGGAAAQATVLGTLLWVSSNGGATWLMLVLVGLLGAAVPPVGVLTRMRWMALLPSTARLTRALFMEGSLDEAAFILGPLLVSVLGHQAGVTAALASVAMVATSGLMALAVQGPLRRADQPPAVRAGDQGAGLHRPLASVCVLLFCLGMAFGSVQVGVVTTAQGSDRPSASGVVLAAFSAVSLLAGLLVGSRPPPDEVAGLSRWLAALCGGMLLAAVCAVPLQWLSLLLLPAAAAASTSVSLCFSHAENRMPARRTGEGLGYLSSALSLGVAAGAGAAGVAADLSGATGAFATGGLSAAVGHLVTLQMPGTDVHNT